MIECDYNVVNMHANAEYVQIDFYAGVHVVDVCTYFILSGSEHRGSFNTSRFLAQERLAMGVERFRKCFETELIGV
jgi:hypothetical protein